MHTLATFHCSFDPIKLVNDNSYFYPCHGQHPENQKLWKDTDCETYCVKPQRAGLFGYCAPCDKKRKNFLRKARQKEEILLQKDKQVLEGVEQENFYSRRPFSTMSPETAKNQLRANAVEHNNMNKKISHLKKKLKADKNIMEILATNSSIRDLVVNVSGIILDEKWNAKEAIIDSLLEVEGKGELDKSNNKERKEFAEHILSKIKNMSKRMSGKRRQQQYLPKLICMTIDDGFVATR
jgi:hypothetical protein